jgi:hypothetical protein
MPAPTRRHEDGGYYEEDFAPYDRDHWMPFVEAYDWLIQFFMPEPALWVLVRWISGGQLPCANEITYFRDNTTTLSFWAGPPPKGPILYKLVREAEQRDWNVRMPLFKAVPIDQEGEPEEIGSCVLLVHCATLWELIQSLLQLDSDTTPERPTRVRRMIIAILRNEFGDALSKDNIPEYRRYVTEARWNQECARRGIAEGLEPPVPSRMTFVYAIDDYLLQPDAYRED